MGTRCADHVTPLYPQKLALTSPTGGGHSVGIARVRTKATDFSFSLAANLGLQSKAHCIIIIIIIIISLMQGIYTYIPETNCP